MKKIKLLITLSSLGTLVTSVPIVTIGCSGQKIPSKSTVTCNFPEINILSNDSEEKEFSFNCQFYDEQSKEINGTTKWEMDMPKILSSDKVSITQNDNKIKVKVNGWSNLNEIKEYEVVVKGQSKWTTLTGYNLGIKKFIVRVIPYNINIIKYDGEQYKLADDINSALFENIAAGTQLPQRSGANLIIEDTDKIQGLSLYAVSSDWNKEIGDSFLSDLESLCFLNISALKDATKIGDEFLEWTKIKSFDGSMFTELEEIGMYAFASCCTLESITFNNNEKLTLIDEFFCELCELLQYIDISGWTGVQKINGSFLCECTALEKISLSSLTNVTYIDDSFLNYCYNLKEIDISGLTNSEYIGSHFMSYCYNLKEIDLSALTNSKYIGSHFLSCCYSLEEIDLSPLSNLNNPNSEYKDEYMLSQWFYHDFSLKRIIWKKETSLKNIKNIFSNYSIALTEIDLSGWTNVENIKTSFLAHSNVLEKLDLRSLNKIKSIGDFFLDYCSNLKELWLPTEHAPILGGWGECLFSLEKIQCGSKLDSYKNAAGWSDLKDLMVE